MPVIALIQFRTYLLSIIPHRGSVRVRVSSYPNINRGMYVRAHDVAAVTGCGLRSKAAGHLPRPCEPRATRRSGGLASSRRSRARHFRAPAAKPRII